MISVTHTLRVFGAALIVAGAIAACGATPSGTSQPVATTAPAAPTAAAAEPTTAPAAPTAAAAEPTTAPAAPTAASSATTSASMAKLNLNEVTEDQLMATIPNFPSRMVREFFEYRPYVSIAQFRQEIGKYVSADQVATYEQYVFVPVDVETADAATLQQIPGVDAAIADQLIAGRPYNTNDAFLAKLSSLVAAADAQAAAGYLTSK